MYSSEEVEKQIQDLWSFVYRIKNGGINPSSLFGTWYSAGAGINGAVGFANSPFTPTVASGIVLYPVDTTGGVVQINTLSGTLQDGQVVFVKDVTGNAGVNPVNFNANNGGGETVENPGNDGHFVAGTVSVTAQGAFVGWKYQLATKRWIGWIGF